jgi:hypothetical protein
MLLPHLWDAVLAQCTIQELHVFRQWNPESAERQLQSRFPHLTRARILKHTTKTRMDLYRSSTVEIYQDFKEPRWHLVRYVDKNQPQTLQRTNLATMQLFSLQHNCALDILHGNMIDVFAGTDDKNMLVLVVKDREEYYIDIWDFQSTIQTHTLIIPESVHYRMTGIECTNILVAPSRQALCFLWAAWFANVYRMCHIIQCDGVVIQTVVLTHAIVIWKENQLYANDELIYTIKK